MGSFLDGGHKVTARVGRSMEIIGYSKGKSILEELGDSRRGNVRERNVG